MHESDKEGYYKLIITGNVFSSDYIKYKSNGDKNKTLLIDDYLNKIEPHLNDLIDNQKLRLNGKFN